MITNIHVHTPFSFSAFSSIEELVSTAAQERVAILGINDLNTADGFREFAACCRASKIFPVYNIEFMVENDISSAYPANGKLPTTYFTGELSGKALPHPLPFPGDVHNLIASIWKGSQDRIWKMIDLLNKVLADCEIPVSLDYTEIRLKHAKASVYEQHVACALNSAIKKTAPSAPEMEVWYERLMGDCKTVNNETHSKELCIINNLLSPGKKAYIAVPADISLTIAQARRLILQMGGIPCYQCKLSSISTADDAQTKAKELADTLIKRKIHAVEFIPQWTDAATLHTFMTFFHKRNFCVSIGTGHFASFNKSTIPLTSNGKPISEELLSIGYEGACILAAHQEYRIHRQPGFLDEEGNCLIGEKQLPAFIAEGNVHIQRVVNV